MNRAVMALLGCGSLVVAACAPASPGRRAERVPVEEGPAPSSAPRLSYCEAVELPPLPSRIVLPDARAASERAVIEALARQHEGDYDEALALVREAVAADPFSFRAHMTAGVVLSARGEHEGAQVAFCLARRLDESSRKALSWIAHSYHKLGWTEEGNRVLRALTELSPDSPRAWYELGYALVRQGRYEPAVEALGRSLALRPEDAAAHYERGYACFRLGRIGEALESYRRAADLRPGHAATWRELAETAFSAQAWPQAEAAARRAMRLEPAEPEAPLWRGRALVAAGRCAKGLKMLRKAQSLASDGERRRYESALAEARETCRGR